MAPPLGCLLDPRSLRPVEVDPLTGQAFVTVAVGSGWKALLAAWVVVLAAVAWLALAWAAARDQASAAAGSHAEL